MRAIFVLSMFGLLGCGAASTDGETEAVADGQDGAYYVLTLQELPACAGDTEGRLVYVKSESKFKVCSASAWSDVEIKGEKGDAGAVGAAGGAGADGAAGVSITDNKLIPPYDQNICTLYSAIEACYFNGGQVLKFSDGSVFLNASYSYEFYYSGGTDPEYDRVSNSVTYILPPDVAAGFARLDWSVSRPGAPMKALFFLYQRSPEKFLVLFDTDGSGTPDPTDETVADLTPTAWP